MRIAVVAASVVLSAAGPLMSTACLTPGEPCCDDDLDCAAGARCFEGRCAPRCDEEHPCDDGLVCVDEALVCARPDRNEELAACDYEEPSR